MSTTRAFPAETATSVLAAVLAGIGVFATLATGPGRIVTDTPAAGAPAIFCCLLLAFVCTESALLHVELRRQAYSFSLSGIALLLGMLYGDAWLVVLARVIGGVLVMAWQHLPLLKAGYNLGAYTLEAALVGLGLHLLLGSGVDLTLASAVAGYVVVALVDLLMSTLVLLVISWHQGRVTAGQALGIFLPAAVLGLTSTVLAVAVTALLDEGALGMVLIILFAVIAALVYRGFLTLRRRHQSLALIHDFVSQGVEATTAPELAGVLLGRTRLLLHASTVELVAHQGDANMIIRVGEDDSMQLERPAAPEVPDALIAEALAGEPLVIPRGTRDRRLRAWLAGRSARDAMIVGVPTGGEPAVLIVQDRLGETSSFTADDLALLQTLAGHIAVALREVRLVQQLRHDATHDVLTGLANRELITGRIEQALTAASGAQAGGGPVVLILGLDRFKDVNDAFGHPVGDALLRVVGDRIAAGAPEGATVARLGGDEFAVLVPRSDRTAASLGAGLLSTLDDPIRLTEVVISARAGVGVAVGVPGTPAGDLLRHADTAMYVAKAGEEPVVLYTPELDRGRAERLTLLADLHLALERDELVVRYQPQLDLHTDRIVSVEALVRWQHPQRGLLAPDSFIPLAESSGLIEELTRQVLVKALRQCRQWRDAGLDLIVAVNLSAQNVNNPDLAANVAAALAAAGLPADRLVLEITESSVMGDPRRTVPILQQLADIGIALSLDDFGTGYSSLAYLQKLPVNELKIDKSFVTGLSSPDAEAHASSALVRTILTLATNLGLSVVAEGVEDVEVLELLRGLGVDLAQGYYIARPLPPDELAALAADRAPAVHNLH